MFRPFFFSWFEFRHTRISVHNGVWGNFDRAGGTFFLGLDADTLNKLVLTVGKPSPGELLSGLDSDTLNKSVLTVGELGPGRGNFFFSGTQWSNTNKG